MNINLKEIVLKRKSFFVLMYLYITMFMGYLYWGLLTISKKHTIPVGILWISNIVVGILILVFTFIMNILYKNYLLQLKWIYGLSLGGVALCIVSALRNTWFQSAVLWLCLFIYICVSFLSLIRKERVDTESILKKAHVIMSEKRLLYGGCIIWIGSLFLLDEQMFNFHWDSLLYYQVCNDLDIESLSNMALYGHMAQGYSVIVYLWKVLLIKTDYAMAATNISLYWISVIYFYRFWKYLFPERKKVDWSLGTLIYALSPFSLGMIYNYSLDFACQCLLVPVLYYMLRKEWGYFTFFSFFFCFTKEPAVIIYACFCLGVLIQEYIREKKHVSLFKYVEKCLLRPLHYLWALPLVFWAITYKALGPWTAGNGSFTLDIFYILEKCKVLYILNFNWIFSIGICISLGYLIWKHQWYIITNSLPLILIHIGFTVFSCAFETVNHPRYIDSNQVTLYLLFYYYLFLCVEDRMRRLVVAIVIILVGLSSFLTIDPLSLVFFPYEKVGALNVLHTVDTPLGDGMIYNRQSLWREGAMEQAIQAAVEEDAIIIFPTVLNNAYSFDGMAKVGIISDKYRVDIEHWDKKKGKRVAFSSTNTLPFTVLQATDNMEVCDLVAYDGLRMNYIYMDMVGKELAEALKRKFLNREETSYSYKGWTVHRLSFVVRS